MQPQTPRLIWRGVITTGIAAAAGLLVSLPASARILDDEQALSDIEVRTQDGVAEVRLLFSMPVRYIKHFPVNKGQLIKLYLQALSLDPNQQSEVNHYEYKRAPSMALTPSFKVTYSTARNCHAVRDPLCLDIQFDKPVQFRIRPGEDGRSILLYVLPDADSRQPAPHGR